MYASSKAWIRSFTIALSKEEKNSGIEIYTFNPGLLLTTLTGKPRLLKGYEGLADTLKKVILLVGDSNENAGRDLAGLAINGHAGKVEIDRMRPSRFVPMILMRLLTGRRADIDVSTIEPVIIEPETE
jgi:NAD(P)-dependent dehydrogenase (short-subunit alcohol dehydrogenase family)